MAPWIVGIALGLALLFLAYAAFDALRNSDFDLKSLFSRKTDGTSQRVEDTDEEKRDSFNRREDQPAAPAAPQDDDQAEAPSNSSAMISGGVRIEADPIGSLTGEAAAYAATLAELNESGAEPGVRLSEMNRLPAERDVSAYWDKKSYDVINDEISRYTVERKQLLNLDTGNQIDYEIYISPASGRINKIISLEIIGNDYLITDYYFNDAGALLFIYERIRPYYAPERALLANDGERFFFSGDRMTKWRVVENGGSNRYEYVIGKKEREKNPKSVTFTIYADLSNNQQEAYDLQETMRLNAAYNTLAAVLSGADCFFIQGNVSSKNSVPVAGATVDLYSERLSSTVYRCQTDSEGKYSISIPPAEDDFRVICSMDGYKPVSVYSVKVSAATVGTYLEPVRLIEPSSEKLSVSVSVGDAFNTDASGVTLRLNDAYVIVRDDYNNLSGEPVAQGRSDDNGLLTLLLPPGCYTAEVQKEGYIASFINFFVWNSDETVYLSVSPTIGIDEMRIVLTWGERPYDLDSHLFTADADHIYYGHMSMPNCSLDVDDVSSYGPETVTVKRAGTGVYKYYVVDFTNASNANYSSRSMSASGATVKVYSGSNLVATFHVPTDTTGLIWEVFMIQDGVIVPIQRYYNNLDDNDWWYAK